MFYGTYDKNIAEYYLMYHVSLFSYFGKMGGFFVHISKDGLKLIFSNYFVYYTAILDHIFDKSAILPCNYTLISNGYRCKASVTAFPKVIRFDIPSRYIRHHNWQLAVQSLQLN